MRIGRSLASLIKGAFLAFAALTAAGLLLGNSVGRTAVPDLCVLTYNAGGTAKGTGFSSRGEVRTSLQRHVHPDIVLLQECPRNEVKRIGEALGLRYRVHAKDLDHKASVAVVSRFPIEQPEFLPFRDGKKGHGLVAARINTPGGTVLVASVHLDRIAEVLNRDKMPNISWRRAAGILQREYFSENLRSRQVDEMLSWLRNASCDQVVVGGDFNTVPLAHAIRRMGRELDDAFWPSLAYFQPTYHQLAWPVQPRIDYIFHSQNISCLERGVLETGPGDHYPAWARLELRSHTDRAPEASRS